MKRVVAALTAVTAVASLGFDVALGSRLADGVSHSASKSKIPIGYRDWRLISVAHEEGSLNDLRAILGNDAAIATVRAGTLPFPDGAIIARLAWRYAPSEENNKAFGSAQSFVAGEPTNGLQFMVKDSKKYAATGGWGFFQYNDGRVADEGVLDRCYACHTPAQARDYVFTRYAP
jgi:Cytochrome P460